MVKLTMDSRAKVPYRADDLQQLLVLIRTAVQNFKRHQPMGRCQHMRLIQGWIEKTSGSSRPSIKTVEPENGGHPLAASACDPGSTKKSEAKKRFTGLGR